MRVRVRGLGKLTLTLSLTLTLTLNLALSLAHQLVVRGLAHGLVAGEGFVAAARHARVAAEVAWLGVGCLARGRLI